MVVAAPISDTRISIGWHCAGTRDDYRGTIAGQLLAGVTSQSDHGFRELVRPGLATSASFTFVPNQYAAYTVVDISIPQGVEDEALRTAKAALDVIGSAGDVTSTQLGIAKDQLWSGYFYSVDDAERSGFLVAGRWSVASLDAYESYLDEVYAIGLPDLDRFAARCVRGRPHVVVLQSSGEHLAASGIDEQFLESRL